MHAYSNPTLLRYRALRDTTLKITRDQYGVGTGHAAGTRPYMGYLVTALSTPSILIFLLLFVGVTLLIVLRRRAWGIAATLAAAVLYGTLGSPWVATSLLGSLEHTHRNDRIDAPPQAIVLLTGYARADRDVPLTGQLNSASAFRVLETARLLANERLPVYISGAGEVPHIMGQALRAVTNAPVTVHLDTQARNTHDSAVNLRAQLGTGAFYLVTSAGHMPRASAVFRALDMRPIPAPTDFYTSHHNATLDLLPSAQYLAMSDLALHERVGMLWYRLRGWVAAD